jgi:hypothetical protein
MPWHHDPCREKQRVAHPAWTSDRVLPKQPRIADGMRGRRARHSPRRGGAAERPLQVRRNRSSVDSSEARRREAMSDRKWLSSIGRAPASSVRRTWRGSGELHSRQAPLGACETGSPFTSRNAVPLGKREGTVIRICLRRGCNARRANGADFFRGMTTCTLDESLCALPTTRDPKPCFTRQPRRIEAMPIGSGMPTRLCA